MGWVVLRTLRDLLHFLGRLPSAGVVRSIDVNFLLGWLAPLARSPTCLCRLPFAEVVLSIAVNFLVGRLAHIATSPTRLCQLPSVGVVRPIDVNFSVRSAPALCRIAPTFMGWLPFAGVVVTIGFQFL